MIVDALEELSILGYKLLRRAIAMHGSIRAYKQWTKGLFAMKKLSPEEINEILTVRESEEHFQLL